MEKRKNRKNTRKLQKRILNIFLSFFLSIFLLYLLTYNLSFLKEMIKNVYLQLIYFLFSPFFHLLIKEDSIIIVGNGIYIFLFTDQCLGIFPIILSIFLIGICRDPIKKKIVIFILFSILIFLVNFLRIIAQIIFSLYYYSSYEQFIFPLVNLVFVFLLWFFMLKRKYLSISHDREKIKGKDRRS